MSVQCGCARDPARSCRPTGHVADVRTGLTAIGEAFVRFLRKPGTTALFRLIIAEGPSVPELAQVGSVVDGPYSVLTRDFLAGAELDPAVGEAQREAAARRFIGVIAGQLLWPSLMDPTGSPVRSEDADVVATAIAATLPALRGDAD